MKLGLTFLGVLAAGVAYLLGTSPSGIQPPVIPATSGVPDLPPWPVYRVAVKLNDLFTYLAIATTPPGVRALQLATGYWDSVVTYMIIHNGIADLLTTPMTCEAACEIAELDVHAGCRFMQAAVAAGILTEKDGLLGLTAVGDFLRADHPQSRRDFALMINEESVHAWYKAATMKTLTESPFKAAHGADLFEFLSKPENARQQKLFDGAMSALGYDAINSLLGEFALEGDAPVICDIGGGRGTLAGAFAEHWPNSTALVLDLPGPAKRATANFKELGVTGKGIGGSFMAKFPAEFEKCDVFMLKFILHDWPDAESVTILKNVKQAAKKTGAKLLVLEHLLGEGTSAVMNKAKLYMDVNMLSVCVPGAKERSVKMFKDLLTEAGYTADNTVKTIPTRGIVGAIEVSL